jgi:alcohol dehydrogenase
MREILYRMFQWVMKVAAYFLPWRKPILLEGENCTLEIPAILEQKKTKRVLLVTDQNITKLGLTQPLLKALEIAQITTTVFDETVPNPTIDNIEAALKLFYANRCEAIIAFGGGSPMDCAKGVGARVAKPNHTIPQLRGNLKILKQIPLLIAIPTTAGTGSETTVAAVVSNPLTHEKYSLNDPSLIPQYAVLDPVITFNLPPHITSTTGIDALTHAVEAYIGQSNTPETRQMARDAVKLISENLYQAYTHGSDLAARSNMLKASFYAGVAFTRAYVGYVHAIAHTLGGFYSVPHGLANAVLLPYVLEYYGESARRPLAELADLLNLGEPTDTQAQKAARFIQWIRDLESRIGIPTKISGIQEADLPKMIKNALREANPLYPVPRILYADDLMHLYQQIRPVE